MRLAFELGLNNGSEFGFQKLLVESGKDD